VTSVTRRASGQASGLRSSSRGASGGVDYLLALPLIRQEPLGNCLMCIGKLARLLVAADRARDPCRVRELLQGRGGREIGLRSLHQAAHCPIDKFSEASRPTLARMGANTRGRSIGRPPRPTSDAPTASLRDPMPRS
jgi:hypothetical protein